MIMIFSIIPRRNKSPRNIYSKEKEIEIFMSKVNSNGDEVRNAVNFLE